MITIKKVFARQYWLVTAVYFITYSLSYSASPTSINERTYEQVVSLAQNAQSGDASSLKQLMELANEGNPYAQNRLALLYESGAGVQKDLSMAVSLLEKAVAKDFPNAKHNLANFYLNGIGVEQNFEKAFRLYKEAAGAGLPQSKFAIGLMYLEGQSVPKDAPKGIMYIQQAAEAGIAGAQRYVGFLYITDTQWAGRKQEGLQLLEKAATQNDSVAQYLLGRAYQDFLIGENNLEKAFSWYKLAADAGFAEAQVHVGIMLSKAIGTPENPVEAFRYLKLAADQRHPYGLTNLGLFYLQGRGVEKNSLIAAKYFQMAVEANIPEAMNFLAVLYETGEGVPKDVKRSIELKKRASEVILANSEKTINHRDFSPNSIRQPATELGASQIKEESEELINSLAKLPGKTSDTEIIRLFDIIDSSNDRVLLFNIWKAWSDNYFRCLNVIENNNKKFVERRCMVGNDRNALDQTINYGETEILKNKRLERFGGYLIKSALSGYSPAQYEIGKIMLSRENTLVVNGRLLSGLQGSSAVAWLKRASDAGHAEATSLLAKTEKDEQEKIISEKKQMDSNPFYYGLIEVQREDLRIPKDKAFDMAQKSMPNCRNIFLAGPVGTTFSEAHMLAKANMSSNPKMHSVVAKQINDGIDCRKAWPDGWSCVGIGYMNPTKAELLRPFTEGFQKHGEAYGDYVQAMARVKFRSGQSEDISVFAQKKNIRCIGSEGDAGMFSGLHWPYKPR